MSQSAGKDQGDRHRREADSLDDQRLSEGACAGEAGDPEHSQTDDKERTREPPKVVPAAADHHADQSGAGDESDRQTTDEMGRCAHWTSHSLVSDFQQASGSRARPL
ncbi:MAG: hypothetical protein NVS3B12_09520 [Acidimicrobiales bacterium]